MCALSTYKPDNIWMKINLLDWKNSRGCTFINFKRYTKEVKKEYLIHIHIHTHTIMFCKLHRITNEINRYLHKKYLHNNTKLYLPKN